MIRRYFSEHSKEPAKYYGIIFVTALVARLIWFLIVVNQVDVEHLGYESPSSDVTSYLASADAIRSDFDFGSRGVYIFGPGYPTFLALARAVLGTDPRAAIILQILLSAIGSVLLAGLALKLTSDKRIALIAGMLNALSVLSCSLASLLLSDTLFFVLVLGSFLVWLSALEKNSVWLGLLAGVLFSAAAFTRSLGQFLIVIAVLMAILKGPVPDTGRAKMFVRRLKLLVPTVLLVAVTTLAWTIRNDQTYDIPFMAGAATGGLTKLNLLIRADLEGVSFEELYQPVVAEANRVEETTDRGEQVYQRHVKSLPGLVLRHPFVATKVFLKNVAVYTNTDWGVFHINLPKWEKAYYQLTRWLKKAGLNFRVTVLAIIGLVMLYRNRRHALATILLAVFAYFAFFSGFVTYQGSRIFYPGQIAWTILASFPLLHIWTKIRSLRSPKI